MKILACALLALILAGPSAQATAPSPEKGKSTNEQPNPLRRATEEFRVLTRELGIRPNSPPSAQRRLGPKLLWHGRVFEYFRNDVLDAIPHEVNQNSGTKSPLRRNQFGFNVAGPVLIPNLVTNPHNTFFMLSYEGVRESISRASLHTVPTLDQRNGDFSQTVDQAGLPLPIYDPSTTVPNPAYNPALPVSTSNLQYLRSPFPENQIPSDRLSPKVREILSLYPPPNTDIGPFFQNNYFVNAPQDDTADGIIARLDHAIGNRHRVSLGTTISNGFLSQPKYFPNFASPTAPDQHYLHWRTDLSYVFTASPKTVNTAIIRLASNVVSAGEGSQFVFPVYRLVDTYLSMGSAYPESHNARNTVEVRDSVSTQQGKHTFNLTLRADQYQVNSFTPEYPLGYFQFSTGLTSLPGITDTGDPFASFLLGLPQYAERTVITSPSYFRDSYQSLAGGDKYEIAKNLTLNANLNLKRHTPRVEKYNRQSTIDPSVIDPATGLPGALVFAGRNGIPRGLRPTNLDLDFGVGVVWNPRGKSNTAVRASFSRSHHQIPIYNGQWGTQGFNARQTFVSPNTELAPAINFKNVIPPLPTPLPNLSPSAADNTIADFMDMSGREPVYRSASMSVEREIPFSMVVTVGASYRDGSNILVGDSATNPNAVNSRFLSYGNALYDETFRRSLQPFPQFQGFELYNLYPAGHYERKASYVRVEKRESYGLSFSALYEYSSQYDDYSGPYGNQDLVNISKNWAPTSYHTPQFVQLSYMYDLPFGPGKPLLNLTGWGGPLVNGWSLSGMVHWNDGRPLALQPEFNNTGGVISTLYVNQVPGVDPHVTNPGPSEWFNPAAFDQPADFTLGNAPRTMSNLLGPGSNSMDVSLDKRVPVGGSSVDFNVTAFNFLNHANWNYPDTTIGPASAPNVNAGKIIGSHGGRVIQLGLIFSF